MDGLISFNRDIYEQIQKLDPLWIIVSLLMIPNILFVVNSSSNVDFQIDSEDLPIDIYSPYNSLNCQIEKFKRGGTNYQEISNIVQPQGNLSAAMKPNKNSLISIDPPKCEIVYKLKTNKHGLREEPIDYEKDSENTRVLVIGDSFSMGAGVKQSKTYSSVLEQKLINSTNYTEENLEIINGGIDGTGLKDYEAFLKEEGVKYQPDLVIVAFQKTDLHSVNETLSDEELDNNSFVKTELKQHIESINNYSKSRNFQTKFFLIWDIGSPLTVSLESWAEKRQIEIIRPPEGINRNPGKYYISNEEPFYNDKGHELLAEKLQGQINWSTYRKNE